MAKSFAVFDFFFAVIIAVSVYSTIKVHFFEFQEAAPHNPKRFAFATLATPAFAMGAVTLGATLVEQHKDKYDLVCLITPDMNDTWIQVLSQWWKVVRVTEYRPMAHFRRSWTKLKVWNLTQYSKIVYIDTDILILRPLDDLFNYPQLSCGVDPNPPQICNTGVMVIEPRAGIFEEMDKMARIDAVRMGIGDQSSINAFFKSFTPLPPTYNVPRGYEPGFGDLLSRGELSVAHFVCKKPWKCGRNNTEQCGCGYQHLNKLWWKVWDKACEGKMCIESWAEEKVNYSSPKGDSPE